MIKLKLINYFDVWGNKKDGYEINNLCVEAEDIYVADLQNRTLLNVLKLPSINFLKSTTRINQVIFEDLHPFIEVLEKKTLLPLCRFEVIEE